MNDVASHYENLLADHYSWMFGEFDHQVTAQRKILEQFGAGSTAGLAVDLGAGSGFQTFALSQLGYKPIIAVDSSAKLLSELRDRNTSEDVDTRHADIRDLATIVQPATAAAISCMGDTLTHLPRTQDAEILIQHAAQALAPGGCLFLTFRDFTRSVAGLDRYIPIRADKERILMCALDFTPEHAVITDLLYLRDADSWQLRKSQYQKLRLAPSQVERWIEDSGLVLTFSGSVGRLVGIAARRP